MSRELVDLMQQTIDEKYVLDRENRNWLLQERLASSQKIKIRANNRHSFAFSLDDPMPQNRPLKFFSSQPPQGIARMCDVIMVCHYTQKCYLFLIEMKSKSKNNYRKQLNNGKLFCDWLLRLYKEHDHTHDSPVFVGLLIWFPRRQPPRKGTIHSAENSRICETSEGVFDRCFNVKNRDTIPIIELCQRCA